MITLPRAGVRAFRSMLRKCSCGRSRGFAPAVLVHADGERTALLADAGEVTLQWTTPDPESEGSLLLPMSVLEAVEGSADAVQFVAKSRSKAIARWPDRGIPQERTFDLPPPKQTPATLELPATWTESTAAILQGLHEAGRMTAQHNGRYALHCVQLQGSKGQIVGTDGNQALIQHGLTFPFTESICVPAVPVFGAKELATPMVRIGRTPTHVVVKVESWTIWLRIDATARFPDVEAAVPKARGATTITLSETDAAFLTDLLPQFPGRHQESAPMTLDVNETGIVVHGQETPDDPPAEIFLTGSKASGTPMRIALDRRFLLRALALGCRRLRFPDPRRPFVALAEHRTYLASVLDPSLGLGPNNPRPVKPVEPVPFYPENAMPPSTVSPEPVPTDLLTEAELLRTAITELAQRANRLVVLLKTKKKEERALNQVFTSLKTLQMGGSPR